MRRCSDQLDNWKFQVTDLRGLCTNINSYQKTELRLLYVNMTYMTYIHTHTKFSVQNVSLAMIMNETDGDDTERFKSYKNCWCRSRCLLIPDKLSYLHEHVVELRGDWKQKTFVSKQQGLGGVIVVTHKPPWIIPVFTAWSVVTARRGSVGLSLLLHHHLLLLLRRATTTIHLMMHFHWQKIGTTTSAVLVT